VLPKQFVFIGIALNFGGSIDYFFSTLKGRVKPNKVTWFLWSLAPLIAFFSQLSQGVGAEAWMTFSVGAIPLFIFIASFFNQKSYWKLKSFDLFCGGLSLLGLFLWQLTRVGNIALLFSIMADFLAGLPTMVKAFYYPETEKPLPYLTAALNGFITLLTIESWKIENYAFSLYIAVAMSILYILIQFKIGPLFRKEII